MGLAELLRKTVLGVALAFSSGSAGCTKQNFRESRVVAEQGLTNQQGEVSFGDQVVAKVQDGTAQLPLENMVVHYLHTGSENTLLAIDPQGNYYPNLTSFTSGESTERRRRKPRKIIIELDQFQEGMGAGQAIVDAFTYQGGDILGEDENYFKYCMSMEDILTTTIDLPAGIILIAPKLVYGEIAEFIASAGTALLKDVVNTFIVAEYGQQPGYEVHSPKQVMSICGEEYNDIICDISGDKLQQLLSPDLPYWHIVGGCTPNGGEMTDPCAPQEGLVFCDDFSGTELDEGKWDVYATDDALTLNNGILEIVTRTAAILESRSSYVLGDKTFTFEARWKVREREEFDFFNEIGPFNEYGGAENGFDFGLSSELGKIHYTNWGKNDCFVRGELEDDPTKYNTFKIEGNKNRASLSLNGRLIDEITTCDQLKQLKIEEACQSTDDQEKKCYLDYIKLIVK